MAQRPISQAVLARRAITRDAVWPIIRAFEGKFVFKQLLLKTDMHATSVREYLKLLVKAGFVSRSGNYYQLIKDNGREAPRINSSGQVVIESTKSEAIWRAVRILGEFDVTEIIIALTSLEVPTTPGYVKDYLTNLCKARYIVMSSEGAPGKKARYRFVESRYTGPKPPKIQRNTAIFDANLNKVVWQSGFVEIDAEGSV